MSEPKYRDWILETIDSLRSRKARPDLERICRMVRRRHGSDPDRTRTELEKLIQEQTVLKVSYKGSISYRNAAKVQRKSRKKSEFTAAGSSSGAEAARERTKHDHLNNNGDSAHSFTDQEEGEEDSEPSPDPQTQTSASTTGKKHKPSSSPSSGNGCLSCGATTGCAVGSGCREEKASASRDKGLGHQAGGDCPSPSHGHRISAHDGGDTGRVTPSKADAIRGGKEPSLSGADTENKTCPGSVSSSDSSLPQRQKQTVPLKPKLRVGGGGTKTAGNQANSDLGDRLVASVRSLSERSLRGGSAAAARGQIKPLGLKEILGYLSSQERLSEEKLTRGKVKVVLEREVARGRLRRTRCGNITLPLRGMVLEEPTPKNASADRLVKSALQDRHTVKKPPSLSSQENEPMETDSEEEDREENEEEDEEDDPRSSDEEGGLSPVAMTTEPGLNDKSTEDAEIQTASKQESPQHQHHCGKGVSALDSLTRTVCPSAQGGSLSHCKSAHLEERSVPPDQLHIDAQDQMQHEGRSHTSSGFNSLECKTEVGVSSCLLTPTASPRDSGLAEERGMNGGVNRGVFMKSEGVSVSPVDWTVSDVVSYFTAAGFPEQAVAFRTQEIDGKSLLLMQRNDVLTGLSIRLGPALKIYERHVKILQKTHFEDDEC
ncbi:sterile alpha motif domain-containing protein 1 [Centroberyx affinis]|uniref:sterile alpha motif domain-containing protein 1 n=1 Tax=Centroberyx affinis TaxID=166261 RepID=UPI003A5B9826